MICTDCFEARNPLPKFNLKGLKATQERNDRELERLFSVEKQEELFKPYRERIFSLFESYCRDAISESGLAESLKELGEKDFKPIEYTCESCGKEISESFKIPILWLIEDEYRKILNELVTSAIQEKFSFSPDRLFESLEYTADFILVADEINWDSSLCINSDIINRLVAVSMLIPREFGTPSDSHIYDISVLVKVYRLFLGKLSSGTEIESVQLQDDLHFQVDLFGKKLSSKRKEWILKTLNVLVEDAFNAS